jgi:hypothetical protein
MATKSLFEAYKNRLAVADTVYGKMHEGAKMSNNRKLVTAKCLENVNRFMNEAFDQSVGTQRADMGMFKKFAMNLTTVALPNLIAHDLVIVHPMSSMSGFITYIEYQYASNKGATKQGDLISNPFGFGNVDADFTGGRIVEPIVADAEGNAPAEFVAAWTPVFDKAFYVKDGKEVSIKDVADGEFKAFKVTAADGTTTYYTDATEYTPAVGDKVAYCYNNVVVPQNDLPMIKAEMKSIALVAKARRIAVYYSQIAAYQAKTDYGVDLGDQLAEKAVGELSYEIDTEVTNLLVDNAGEARAELTWDKTLPIGVSKAEHYEGFTEILEIAKQHIYDATKKFQPNYMLAASNLLPILSVCKGWHPAPAGSINGPFFAGTINNLKVFVTPNIDKGTFVIGCNGNDMMSSAAVYAPYMAIVPTQLLGYADGGMSQGWSTMYDLKILNKNLLVKGAIKG